MLSAVHSATLRSAVPERVRPQWPVRKKKTAACSCHGRRLMGRVKGDSSCPLGFLSRSSLGLHVSGDR